ncbi:methyltransferase, FkbM family, partial [Candidatus Nitrosopumilus salaria BD31]
LSCIAPTTSLDIGANIGNHAIVIAQYTKRLIVFEPVQFIFSVLQQNLILNKLNNVIAVNLALSDKAIKRDISIPKHGNLGCSSLNASFEDAEQQEIELVVGDDYLNLTCPKEMIDFIKMDVEGHEASALLGLQETLKQDQPLLLIEYKSTTTIASFQKMRLFDELFKGYQFFSLSYTYNKKVHKKNLIGFLRRIYFRIFDRRWCLSSFDQSKPYANVYLVPPRYQKIFATFSYLSAEK